MTMSCIYAWVQVFPLLLEQFSPNEQASFVWEFFCSIPVILLEELLPWIISFLSPEKQVEVIHCIRKIVPKEKYLQEVDPELNSLF